MSRYIDFNAHTPSTWSRMSSEHHTIVELSQYDSTYSEVLNELNSSFYRPVTKISRAQNPYSYYRFLLRQEEYRSRGITFGIMKLYHATSVSNIPSIIKNNLDWRRANRVKFGQGVSFSPSGSYANLQCNRGNGSARVMIQCSVIVGSEYPGSYSTKIPPNSYDTTTGNCKNVYVKYYDDEFYPEYLLYYKN